jgi:hypothetical protein
MAFSRSENKGVTSTEGSNHTLRTAPAENRLRLACDQRDGRSNCQRSRLSIPTRWPGLGNPAGRSEVRLGPVSEAVIRHWSFFVSRQQAPPPDEGTVISALAGSECRSARHGPAPGSFAALRRPSATRPLVSLGAGPPRRTGPLHCGPAVPFGLPPTLAVLGFPWPFLAPRAARTAHRPSRPRRLKGRPSRGWVLPAFKAPWTAAR